MLLRNDPTINPLKKVDALEDRKTSNDPNNHEAPEEKARFLPLEGANPLLPLATQRIDWKVIKTAHSTYLTPLRIHHSAHNHSKDSFPFNISNSPIIFQNSTAQRKNTTN